MEKRPARQTLEISQDARSSSTLLYYHSHWRTHNYYSSAPSTYPTHSANSSSIPVTDHSSPPPSPPSPPQWNCSTSRGLTDLISALLCSLNRLWNGPFNQSAIKLSRMHHIGLRKTSQKWIIVISGANKDNFKHAFSFHTHLHVLCSRAVLATNDPYILQA